MIQKSKIDDDLKEKTQRLDAENQKQRMHKEQLNNLYSLAVGMSRVTRSKRDLIQTELV